MCYEFDSAVQAFHESNYLVSGDRRRTNFPVREAHNAYESFAVSAIKERDVVVGHLPYAFFQSCTNSAFLQTFSLNAHSLCNPCSL